MIRGSYDTATGEVVEREHFGPLRLALGLQPAGVGAGWAEAGHVRVFLEEERGLCWFALGPAGSTKPLCSVEELATRFPRVRVMAGGHQRLTHQEQCSFLQDRWEDIQLMFSPAQLPETIAWQAAVAKARIEEYAKRT